MCVPRHTIETPCTPPLPDSSTRAGRLRSLLLPGRRAGRFVLEPRLPTNVRVNGREDEAHWMENKVAIYNYEISS